LFGVSVLTWERWLTRDLGGASKGAAPRPKYV